MPWVNRPANGSRAQLALVRQSPGDEARVKQVQHGVLDAADVLVDRHPVVRRRLVDRRFGAFGPVKRAKYQEEVDEGVEGVGVAHGAAPPQLGQVVCFQVGWRARALPGRLKSMSARQHDRQVASRAAATGPHAEQWMMGIGQPQPRWRETPQSRRR